jgi:hypothetical protein
VTAYGSIASARMRTLPAAPATIAAAARIWSVSTGCHDRGVKRHPALQEREIFPWIEDAMPEPALDALGRALR